MSEIALAELQGSWLARAIESDGASIPMSLDRLGPERGLRHPFLSASFRGNGWFEIGKDGKADKPLCAVKLDPSLIPKTIDLIRPDGIIRGIYRCKGDLLTLCLNAERNAKKHPREFTTRARKRPRFLSSSSGEVRTARVRPKAQRTNRRPTR